MVTFGPKAAPWLALALLISLGVNLAVGGALVGRTFAERSRAWVAPGERLRAQAPGEKRLLPGILGRMAASLPEEYRNDFVSTLKAHKQELLSQRRAIRQQRRKIREMIAAQTLDRAALDAAFAELRARNEAFQAVLHRAIGDAVEKLPAEARRDLANFQRRGPRP